MEYSQLEKLKKRERKKNFIVNKDNNKKKRWGYARSTTNQLKETGDQETNVSLNEKIEKRIGMDDKH